MCARRGSRTGPDRSQPRATSRATPRAIVTTSLSPSSEKTAFTSRASRPRQQQQDPAQNRRVEADRQQPRAAPGVDRPLRARRPPARLAKQALELVIEPPGRAARGLAHVLQQPEALRGDRRADLGRLGDALDQLLSLLALQHLVPDLVGGVALQHLLGRARGRVAVQGPIDLVPHGVVEPEATADPARRPPAKLDERGRPRGRPDRPGRRRRRWPVADRAERCARASPERGRAPPRRHPGAGLLLGGRRPSALAPRVVPPGRRGAPARPAQARD